jgi:membrane-associated protease RseP (regulator of RpoE activity)
LDPVRAFPFTSNNGSSNENPDVFAPAPSEWPPRRKFQDRRWRNVVLLLLTMVTTTMAGADAYLSFLSDLGGRSLPLALDLSILVSGLWYSVTILTILGFHEMGHYLACRYYDVDASLPFFIPAPQLTGTLGAFIRIREPIPSKRMLFDIGIAGPIAGFLVAVPALILGLSLSNVVRLPPDFRGFSIGEPLLFKAASLAIWGSPPDGYAINMHPTAFAAWFGLLATALNLLPIGQLDGGHISYAVLGRRSSHVTMATIAAAVVLTYFSPSWAVWTVLMIVMLVLFGRHHPQAFDEHEPLDRTRTLLALVAVAMFVLCFTPVPIEPLDLLSGIRSQISELP